MQISEQDRAAIEQLEFDPTLKPTFDIIKSCLIWRDESPTGASADGRRFVSLLWIYRSFQHRRISDDKWPVDSRIYREAWEYAVRENIKWPGLRRLSLSDEDLSYLEAKLNENHEG